MNANASHTPMGSTWPHHAGLRMDADRFFQIHEDETNYELIDGVVTVTPSPSPKHQHVTGEIYIQLSLYLRQSPVGFVFLETDVHLGQGPTGGDLVYRPEIAFIRREHVATITDKLSGPPALVVEVVSRGSRRMDSETKKLDYERFGVQEYWLIDPERQMMSFFRLDAGRYVEVDAVGSAWPSDAVPGFVLDLDAVREAFRPW